jgi:aryl-alcohol dehydrogenase-like predicted oxidoreductase
MAIEKLQFGSTGHLSTRTLFGAAAFWSCTQAEADRTLELLLAHGVNHIDTAASYGDAEVRLGPWMAQHRDDFFLATKTEERTRAGAHDQIRRSLERLRVDSVDLIQLHNLVDRDEWEVALGPGGALEAAIEARDEGLVRFIGVTGHGVDVAERHRESLERFPFDSVLLPVTYIQLSDERYADQVDALLALCADRGVAVQSIKSLSKGRWGAEHAGAPWYEPLTDRGAIGLAVAWTLAQPGLFLNTVSDLSLLPYVLDAAEQPAMPPSNEQMDALVADQGITPLFDAANPV